MKYIALRSFINKFDAYRKEEQDAITIALDKIKEYIETNQAPYGFTLPQIAISSQPE